MPRHIYPALLVTALMLSGCATFRDGANPPIDKWPPDISKCNKSIALQISGNASIARKELFLVEAVRVYASSGYFSSANAEPNQSDIYADVNIAEDYDAYNRFECGHGICAVLFLIPLKQGHKCFIIKTTYKDNVGNTLGSVDKTECLYRWSHLFLIPFMFTNSWDSVGNEVFVDLNRNTIIEANKTGIF
jgi:hypothetical protein